jgi:hypothetical protein
MNDVLQKLDEIFKLISSIPVNGDSVDVMAMVRNNLRIVYAELKKNQ